MNESRGVGSGRRLLGRGVCMLLALCVASCVTFEDSETRARRDARRRLESLGYVDTVPVTPDSEGKVGVTLHDPEKAYPGLNLFNSRDQSTARLMTMEGEDVHTWTSDEMGDTFDEGQRVLTTSSARYLHGWNQVEMAENGDLFVIGSHHMLMRLDWDSNVLWKRDVSAHHDLAIAADGTVYVLVDGIRSAEVDGEPVGFQDNDIVVFSPDGEELRRISLYDALKDGEWGDEVRQRLMRVKNRRRSAFENVRKAVREDVDDREALLERYQRAARGEIEGDDGILNVLFHNRVQDIFHSNSIQVLERDEPGLWRAGDLLICILRLDMIAVIDRESGRVIWTWGTDELEAPHHPTFLPDGNVLVFDNGVRRRHSRVVKMDPRSGEIVWQYVANPPESFFTDARGGCQELPNGNVLITETNTGRAFEVTPEGEIVWEYYNEILEGVDEAAMRGAIYRMTRMDHNAVEHLTP